MFVSKFFQLIPIFASPIFAFLRTPALRPQELDPRGWESRSFPCSRAQSVRSRLDAPASADNRLVDWARARTRLAHDAPPAPQHAPPALRSTRRRLSAARTAGSPQGAPVGHSPYRTSKSLRATTPRSLVETAIASARERITLSRCLVPSPGYGSSERN